jgi:hypothetical protein
MEKLDLWHEFVHKLRSVDRISIVGPMAPPPGELFGPTLFIDGGARFDRGQVEPKLSIGDGDSAEQALDVILAKEKDVSDLGFVLRGLPESVLRIDLWGFEGGRSDHLLANWAEALDWVATRPLGSQAFFHGHNGEQTVAFRGVFQAQHHGTFSVFSWSPSRIAIAGECVYTRSLEDPPLRPFSSHGLSNKAFGSIEIQSRSPSLVFLHDGA